MSALVVDRMDNVAPWMALAADGVTPSTELTAVSDELVAGYGDDGVSVRLTATSAADGHVVRRILAPVDMAPFTELRLSLRANRTATAQDQSFFLQLRLGSAALPVTSADNTWHRLLPLRAANRWNTVKLGIDDLDATIRGAVSTIELRCLTGDRPFVAHIDDLTAVLPEMLADADRALTSRLEGITVGGNAVSPAVRSSSEPLPAAAALDITQLDLARAPTRMVDVDEPRDYTLSGGVRMMAAGVPYDVTYAITPVAADRSSQAALLERVVARIAPFDELVVDGDRLPIELIHVAPDERVGGSPGPDPVLFYRVGARAWRTTARSAQAAREITIAPDLLETL